jgi:rhamnosyltransferase
MKTSDVSIILLTKNAGDLFREVLAALSRCEGVEQSEILMIDSGSEDRTLEYAQRHGHIRIHRIPPSEFGHGKTRNLAARLTTRPILAFLVQDATPANREFLCNLIQPLARPKVAGVCGRQIAYGWSNRVERMFLEHTYPDDSKDRAADGSRPLRIHDMFFSNVCSALRRAVWEKIPFDETLIMSEDQAWAKAALLQGYRIVYEASAIVYHSHNYKLLDVLRRNFDSGLSLRGVADDSFRDIVTYELRYLATGISKLWSIGDPTLIPYFFAYEAARSAGFALGRRSDSLPLKARRFLSLHGHHWKSARIEVNSPRTQKR